MADRAVTMDPDTFRLQWPDGKTTFTAAEWGTLRLPTCPVCGETVLVERIHVPTCARKDAYIAGRWTCPNDCNPFTGGRPLGPTSSEDR